MENIQTTVLIVHTLIALGIIALVLLQRGKGAEAGAAFGAGASGTVFGAQGSTNPGDSLFCDEPEPGLYQQPANGSTGKPPGEHAAYGN